MFPVAILAGGLAMRMRPLTETIPKSLIEVAGKPFIFHQLTYLKKQNIKSVILCTGYLGDKIYDYVGDGSKWGIDVRYSPDGPHPLGTGGAIKKALSMLGECFFVLYGDSYLPVDFKKVQKSYIDSEKKGLMTIIKNNNKWDISNVELDFDKIKIYDKNNVSSSMTHIDFGLGLLNEKIFEAYQSGAAFELSEIYRQLSLDGELFGYEVFERFYEIGSRQGLLDTHNHLMGLN